MNLLKPRPLQRGSHVRIVSPSGPVTPPLIASALATLETWGLRVSVDADAYASSRYLAGSDAVRRQALQRAIDDPDVDAILCSRGGYGAMRIIADLDFTALRRDPRILSGFSDITAIHFAALQAGVATLHGHVAKSFASQATDLDAFRATLFGERGPLSFRVQTVRPGDATGPVIGGNLSLVVALAGTRFLPSMDGALLFLEDVTEEDYRLDRLFTALRLNPAFAGVAGVILGGFDECAGSYVGADEMAGFVATLGAELGDAWDVPVVAGFPAGHASRNAPLPLGVSAVIDGTGGAVRFDEEFTR